MKACIKQKHDKLIQIIRGLKKVIIAYSGGVDSSLLVYCAGEAVGKKNVLAVTANSETFTEEELEYTRMFTAKFQIPHKIINTCELAEINLHGNTRDRCYHCKKELFSTLQELAQSGDYSVIEGSNLDDNRDYRPGARAIRELQISSPLKEAGLTKQEIRDLSREFGLPSWNKPAYACLTSRFPYNVSITARELRMVEAAEKYLHKLGFQQCRVRHYGNKARIEVTGDRVELALQMKYNILTELKKIGYREIEIDPAGYRMGSMNLFNQEV